MLDLMSPLQRNHPIPKASVPTGLDPSSLDSVRRFIAANNLPSGAGGRFVFAFLDEHNDLAGVRLRHGLAGHRQPPVLTPCAGGLHVIELDAPSVNRIEYRFSLIDQEGQETLITDPLNHNTISDPFARRSVVTTSAYQPPLYIAAPPQDAVGMLDQLSIVGPLGKPWLTWIWQPPRIDRGAPLPVVLFLDGSDWLTMASARNMFENLVHEHAIAPCRAVFVKPDERNAEYAANPRMAEFLADGLGVALGEHMPWPIDLKHRTAVGVSLGALCLLFTHFKQPHAFGQLLLQSGSFFQPQTDAMETGYPRFKRLCDFVGGVLDGSTAKGVERIPIHMTCGMGEENDVNNHVMADALARLGFAIVFAEQPDAHNWTCWRDSVGAGLMRLLRPA